MSTVRGIHLNGPSKVGKGYGGARLKSHLETAGYKVYSDVAGDFCRRMTAATRQELDLGDKQPLPEGDVVLRALAHVIKKGKIFESGSFTDLQRPAVANCVSSISRHPLAQDAVNDWFGRAVDAAHAAEADVLLLDGRDPRKHVNEQRPGRVNTALDLFLTGSVEKGARMTLHHRGISHPTAEQLVDEMTVLQGRRDVDSAIGRKNRLVEPSESVLFVPDEMSALDAVWESWDDGTEEAAPSPVKLDMTYLNKEEMAGAIIDLGTTALEFAAQNSFVSIS